MALSQEERNWAAAELYGYMQDEDCVNNERFADSNDAEEIASYNKARWGCCRTFDTVEYHPMTGKKILIGCDYGN